MAQPLRLDSLRWERNTPALSLLPGIPRQLPAVEGWHAKLTYGEGTQHASQLKGEEWWTIDAMVLRGEVLFSNGFGFRSVLKHMAGPEVALLCDVSVQLRGRLAYGFLLTTKYADAWTCCCGEGDTDGRGSTDFIPCNWDATLEVAVIAPPYDPWRGDHYCCGVCGRIYQAGSPIEEEWEFLQALHVMYLPPSGVHLGYQFRAPAGNWVHLHPRQLRELSVDPECEVRVWPAVGIAQTLLQDQEFPETDDFLESYAGKPGPRRITLQEARS